MYGKHTTAEITKLRKTKENKSDTVSQEYDIAEIDQLKLFSIRKLDLKNGSRTSLLKNASTTKKE
jgi:hypothetical protein